MLILSLLAQAAAAVAPPAPAPQQGVTSYPAAFFSQYQPANASEMVDRIPGFTFDAGAGVRGYEGSAGNVLIDGQRPATKTDDLEQVLRRVPAGSVERIDVIRGGAPGIDMQGKTVIANVVRKAGGGFRALVSVSNQFTDDGRKLPAGRIELSGSVGKSQWELASADGKSNDDGFGGGPGQRIDAQGHVTPVRIQAEGDSPFGQVTAGLQSPLGGGKLHLNARLYRDKYKGEESDQVLGPIITSENEVDTFRDKDSEIGGNYTHSLGPRSSLEIVGLHQTHDVKLDNRFFAADSSVFLLDRKSSETIARAVLKHSWNDRLSVEAGAETAINKQDSETRFSSDGVAIPLPAANVQVEEHRSEAFAKGTWRPANAWTVDASLRYEHTRITSDGDVALEKTLQFLKPRLAVTWDALPSTQIRLRLEREVGQLNFSDFVATGSLNNGSGITAGNPNLNPQQAWVGEAALEQQFWKSASVSVTYRHSELSDAIDRGPVFAPNGDVFDQPTNIGDGTKDELVFAVTLPLDRLGLKAATLKGDATRRWSSVTDPTTHRKREISGLHPTDWNLNFTQDIQRWRLSYGVEVFGGWRETYYRFDLIETDKLRTYVKPFVEWRPKPDLSLRIEIPNATARDFHKVYASYPGPRSAGGKPSLDDRLYQPGRVFYIRIRKTFGG